VTDRPAGDDRRRGHISVCFASRGRPGSLAAAIGSLITLADDPARVQVLIAADPDDAAGTGKAAAGAGAACWVAPERYGYTGLHHYLNELATMTDGQWLMWFNDDARMLTQGWDTVIRGWPRPAVLWPHANHLTHANLFPVWPGAWSDATGRVSPVQHMDSYLQGLGQQLQRHDQIPVHILHDRADVTGGHDDQTYAEGRHLLGPEGMVPGFSQSQMRAAIQRDANLLTGAGLT
jgi:hypothetical protein